jgi:hypothetical protein
VTNPKIIPTNTKEATKFQVVSPPQGEILMAGITKVTNHSAKELMTVPTRKRFISRLCQRTKLNWRG